ncbi:MAG: histidine phosphatase family protein [bacterium]|nr:histidine phosphatase family protein [bacterium]
MIKKFKNFDASETLKTEAEPDKAESRIVLYFRRHGKKEQTLEGQTDTDVPLTKEGRGQAVQIGKDLNVKPEMTIAFGSRRKRAQEVAARAMLANEDDISPNMPLDQLKARIAKELGYGQKIIEDRRLDFNEGKGTALGVLTDKAYAEKRTAEFMIHDSDRIAQETKDLTTSTYTRLASQVAELVQKYAKIGSNFHRIVEEDPEKYKKFQNQMERFMGTHNTVSDSFVAKVIEKQQGIEERERFLQSVGPLGFKEAEGFNIEVINRGGNQEIRLNVKAGNEEWNIDVVPDTIGRIIDDRVEFDRAIKAASKN